MCGDFNACIGEMKDFVVGVDNVIDRICINSVEGGHYKYLLTFLVKIKMCIVNGRINSGSVIDYMCVSHDDLKTV